MKLAGSRPSLKALGDALLIGSFVVAAAHHYSSDSSIFALLPASTSDFRRSMYSSE
jgi:hypothetical protein